MIFSCELGKKNVIFNSRLHAPHGQISGTQFLIFSLKILKAVAVLQSSRIVSHNLGVKKEAASVHYRTERTLCIFTKKLCRK